MTSPPKNKRKKRADWLFGPRVPLRALALATRQMSVMFKSGVKMGDVLAGCCGENPVLDEAFEEIRDGVLAGEALPAMFGRHPHIFDKEFVGLITAGMESGRLVSVLERMSDQLELRYERQQKIKAMAVYPTILGVMTIFLSILFLTWILPALSPQFQELGEDLPWPTQVLLTLSEIFTHPLLWLVGLFLLWSCRRLFKKWQGNERGRQRWGLLLLKLPLFGPLHRCDVLSSTLEGMSLLLRAGTRVDKALEICEKACKNSEITRRVAASRRAVYRGDELHKAFHEAGFLDQEGTSLVQVGGQTGTLPKKLKYLSKMYEERLEVARDRLGSLMSPVILGVMGFVGGFVIVASLAPTVALLNSF